MKDKKVLRLLYSSIARTRTNILASALYFAGLICFALTPIMLPRFGEVSQDILFSLAFFCWGMTGLLYIIRQEVDFGILIFRGVLAIILGFIIMALCFFLALYPYIANGYPGIIA